MEKEKKKKTVVTKKVGLNGKSGERRANSRSRAARARAVSEQRKVKEDPRNQSPSARDLGEKVKSKKEKKKFGRRTTVKAPLPKGKRSSSRSHDIEAHLDDEENEDILEPVEQLLEVDFERPSQDSPSVIYDKNSTEDVDTVTDASNRDISEDNQQQQQQQQQQQEPEPQGEEFTLQAALKAADAALYTIGKFIGENTCHTSDNTTVKESEDNSKDTKTTSSYDRYSSTEGDYANNKQQLAQNNGYPFEEKDTFTGYNPSTDGGSTYSGSCDDVAYVRD